jgi:Xaa-Pro dipeptidase
MCTSNVATVRGTFYAAIWGLFNPLFWGLLHPLLTERLAAVILPREGDPVLVVCTIEQAQAERDSRIRDIRGYVEFAASPMVLIGEVLQEKGLDGAKLGIETRVLTAHYYDEMKQRLPGARLASADDLLSRLRMVKQSLEIETLAHAALSTDRAIRAAYESGRIGSGDKIIADNLANGIQLSGADQVAFLVLGAGPSAALAHPSATQRPLEVGDVVRCDAGGHYSGYYSDLARTAVVGRATDEQQDIYRRLWAVHESTIAAALPGVRACDLYHHCRQAFADQGLEMKMPHIGHSLGIGLHELPILSPFDETILAEGMVLAIEPIHRCDGGPIFHVEDLVEVTANGPRVLSRSADWSQLMIIDG